MPVSSVWSASIWRFATTCPTISSLSRAACSPLSQLWSGLSPSVFQLKQDILSSRRRRLRDLRSGACTTVSLSLSGELLLKLALYEALVLSLNTSSVCKDHFQLLHAPPAKYQTYTITWGTRAWMCPPGCVGPHGGSSMWAKLLCGYKQVRGSTPTSPYGLGFKSPTFLNMKSQLKVRKRAMNPPLRHHSERQQKQTVCAAHSCLTW